MLRNKEPELAEKIDSSFGCFDLGFYRVNFVFGSRHLIIVHAQAVAAGTAAPQTADSERENLKQDFRVMDGTTEYLLEKNVHRILTLKKNFAVELKQTKQR